MKKHSSQAFGLALLAGAGIGMGCGLLLFNEKLRHQLGRKMRHIARACRYQSAELREAAGEFIENRGRNLKVVREGCGRLYERLAG